MTPRDEVLEQALSLSPDDRAFVAAALEQSLPHQHAAPVDSSEELLRELDRRSADLRSGKAKLLPVDEVMTDLRKLAAKETPT